MRPSPQQSAAGLRKFDEFCRVCVCVCVINFNLCGTEAVSVKLLFEISMLEAIASRKCYL